LRIRKRPEPEQLKIDLATPARDGGKVRARLDAQLSGLFGGVRMIVCDLNGAALGALTDTRLLSDDTSILISDLPRGIREAPTSPVFEVPNLGSHRRSAGMFQTRHGSNASRRDWCEV
jgi:hypothetical protein